MTCHGKPIVEETIIFQPVKGRQSIGEIGPDGTCTPTTFEPGDGALLGRHRVSIEARRITETFLPDGAYGPPKVEWLVPEKYSSSYSSNLTAEVKKGDNKIDFDL
ncbi:MAG: hypothetical protein JW959_08945 [Pirellulales bacterium]|nr:hypothetical protein [Pirellulales bacterium]